MHSYHYPYTSAENCASKMLNHSKSKYILELRLKLLSFSVCNITVYNSNHFYRILRTCYKQFIKNRNILGTEGIFKNNKYLFVIKCVNRKISVNNNNVYLLIISKVGCLVLTYINLCHQIFVCLGKLIPDS